MDWGHPAYLWLALVPLLLLFAGLGRRASTPSGWVSPAPRRRVVFRGGLFLVGVLLVVAALGAPRWGELPEEREATGADVLVLLDTSRSMQADDINPSRLAAAKEAVLRLVRGLGGERVGLVAFAGSAFLVCPLTDDYGAFEAALAEAGNDTIPLRGTSLAAALKEAGRAFPPSRAAKVAILISDGEDHEGGYRAAAEELRRRGVTLFCVAAGSAAGSLIPKGGGEFFKDGQGRAVKTTLQLASLQAVAGGRLVQLSGGGQVLAELYRRERPGLERATRKHSRIRRAERFQIPLALALVLLSLEPWLAMRSRL